MSEESDPRKRKPLFRRIGWRERVQISLGFAIIIAFVGGIGYVSCQIVFPAYSPYTTYAPGYSHTEFRKITIGMPRSEVVARLGEPLRSIDGRNVSIVRIGKDGNPDTRLTASELMIYAEESEPVLTITLDENGNVMQKD